MSVNIPLTSPIDLETENIIQGDFSFKRKNSLVYKGILSNMRYKKGQGLLSTTGKNITTTSNSVVVDGTSIAVPNIEAYITKSEYITISNDTLFIRPNNETYLSIRKPSSTSVILNNGTTTYTFEDLNAIDINGTISSDNRFIIVSYYETSTKVTLFDTSFTITNQFTVNSVLGSKTVTSYVYYDQLFIGFDSEDIRKRFCYVVENNTFTEKVHGMGLVSETGLLTGEPFFYTLAKATTQERDIKNANDLSTYPNQVSHISYTDNSYYHHQKFLDNGIMQTERFDTTVSGAHYSAVASGTSTSYTWDDRTMSTSWIEAAANQTAEPTYPYPQTNGLPTHGIMNFAPGDSSLTGNDNNITTIHVYVYAIQIENSGILSPKMVPAMRRSPFLSVDNSLNYAYQYNSYADTTEISFMNIDAPLGQIKTGIIDGEQVFPHMRFFGNNTNEKGTYWDYGKGWVRFYYDTIHFKRLSSYGSTIFEEPLKIITYDLDGLKVEIADVSKENKSDAYVGIEDGSLANVTGWIWPLDGASLSNTKWYYYDNSQSGGSAFMGNTRLVNDVNILRLHPVSSEQLTAKTWFWNHSFGTELLSSLPFSVRISNKLYKQIYNGIDTSISYNKTLLFTPHSLEDKYTFNENEIIEWSEGNATYAKIETTGTIKVTKMTDFVFKMNVIASKNVLTESRTGDIQLQRAFIPYIMDNKLNSYIGIDYTMPVDSTTKTSNDVYYFAAGYNSTISEKYVSTSFLLPAVSVAFYLDTELLSSFNKELISNKNGLIRADISKYFFDNELVEEYWTHTQATTDVSYKNSKFLISGNEQNTYDSDYIETSWIPSATTIIYPIGILSKVYGENYITSTVDVGDNYVSRFYNKNNKTFLIFNNIDQVYYGSEIFTIQSGNYYFDGQGIYYLGSQSDYSQNVFTAYAIGMKFLANSSSEAYFYSPWDKSLYLYTASNTLQRSISLSDMGNIVDSLYSPVEQALYILFDDGKLYIKTQTDSCLVEDVTGTSLQSTNVGTQSISGTGYEIYNPYMWSDISPLHIETEWLGSGSVVTKYQYVDLVFFSETPKKYSLTAAVDALNGGEITHITKDIYINASDWNNNLCRVRIVPKEISGNAIKIFIDSDEEIHLFTIDVSAATVSQQPSASRSQRY